jgi:predicted nucleotidyltransferase
LQIPIKGIIIPTMGMSAGHEPSMAGALFSRVQQRVLGLLFCQPDRSFFGAEVIRSVRSGSGAVQRELSRLAGSGLVTVTRVGNQKHYRANRDSPVFAELQGLVRKTLGLAAPLRQALAPLEGRICTAFTYGSAVQGADTTRSDLDLMVIAEGISYPELFEALQAAEAALQRQICPRLNTLEEWSRKLAAGSSFVVRVAAEPKIFLIGSDSDLS